MSVEQCSALRYDCDSLDRRPSLPTSALIDCGSLSQLTVRRLDAHVMIIRSLTKEEVEVEPFQVWNAFVDLLSTENYGDLSSEQRPAHLVFWYESEVQNGGHFQYFENRGAEHLAATVEALGSVGATCQQELLREAGELWLSLTRSRVQTTEEFCDTALEDEFEAFDSRFHDCSPSVQECLEAHLERYQAFFVSVTCTRHLHR